MRIANKDMRDYVRRPTEASSGCVSQGAGNTDRRPILRASIQQNAGVFLAIVSRA